MRFNNEEFEEVYFGGWRQPSQRDTYWLALSNLEDQIQEADTKLDSIAQMREVFPKTLCKAGEFPGEALWKKIVEKQGEDRAKYEDKVKDISDYVKNNMDCLSYIVSISPNVNTNEDGIGKIYVVPKQLPYYDKRTTNNALRFLKVADYIIYNRDVIGYSEGEAPNVEHNLYLRVGNILSSPARILTIGQESCSYIHRQMISEAEDLNRDQLILAFHWLSRIKETIPLEIQFL